MQLMFELALEVVEQVVPAHTPKLVPLPSGAVVIHNFYKR
jgi:hypothetical protein